ncbi:MAG: glycosyltransferase [Thermoplasmatota archaeon]
MTSVLLVWPNFEPTNAAGVRGRAFARGIAQAGAAVTVVAPPDPLAAQGLSAEGVGPAIRSSDSSWVFRGVPLWREMHDPLLSGRRALQDIAREVHADIVIASSPSGLCLLQAHAAFAGKGPPLVADVRDLAAESLIEAYGSKPRYAALRHAEGHVYRRARGVLAVTRIMKGILEDRYRVAPERTHFVPNGADVAAFAAFQNAAKTVDVLFSGAIEGRRPKDVALAFRAILAKRPATTFRMLGWRGGPAEREFEDTIGPQALAQVERVAPVPAHKVPAQTASARIGILPQVDAALSRMAVGAKAYEYMAAGVPIVALGPGGESEAARLLTEERCGLYETQVDAFAASIVALLDDDARRQSLAGRAAAAAPRYDRGAIVRACWDSVLKPIAEGRA